MEGYYEVVTNMAVGDMPRAADIVLLRRTSERSMPFRGLWMNLTTCNVLEFKGPTVSARAGDLDLLIELGLGVERKLNEERRKQKLVPLGPREVSFWYVANRLGRRFLHRARQKLGSLEASGSGLWRCAVLERMVFLISSADLPVEEDTLPLHIVGIEPHASEVAVARFMLERPALWQLYGPWLVSLHPTLWEEVRAMARAAGKEFKIDLTPFVENLGMDEIVQQLGLRKIIDEVGVKRAVDEVGLKRVVEEVGLKRVVDEVGLKRVVEEVGLKRVLEEAGPDRVIDEMGWDWFLSKLTPAQRREAKRRLR